MIVYILRDESDGEVADLSTSQSGSGVSGGVGVGEPTLLHCLYPPIPKSSTSACTTNERPITEYSPASFTTFDSTTTVEFLLPICQRVT